MGEYKDDCQDKRDDCCYCDRPRQCCCNNDSGSGVGILILIVVLVLLFSNNDNDCGGPFGGLFG